MNTSRIEIDFCLKWCIKWQIVRNSLSLGQVRDVINGKTVLGEQKEIQEVKNAYAAYEKLTDIDPFNIQDLKAFHGIMTKYLVNESGDCVWCER